MPDIVRGPTPPPWPTIYVGIDPGVSGGVAILFEDEVATFPMPATSRELWGIIRPVSGIRHVDGVPIFCKHVDGHVPVFCALELVTGWTGGYNRKEGDDGTTTNPGSHMLQLGRRVGWAEMLLAAAGISHEVVAPRTWQRALRIPVREKGIDGAAWKRVLKAEAQRRFPQVKVTLKVADALLLACYCKEKYGG